MAFVFYIDINNTENAKRRSDIINTLLYSSQNKNREYDGLEKIWIKQEQH